MKSQNFFLLLPIILIFFMVEFNYSQHKPKIYIEADSLTKEKLNDHLEKLLKENPKIQYEILKIKPSPNANYKMQYAYIDTTIDYKILIYNPEKSTDTKVLKKLFQKGNPDSVLKPKK